MVGRGSSKVLLVEETLPECVGRVNRTFCFTGAIDVLQGAVLRRPISP